MLFLGAPALGAPPLGLGHRAAINGHHLPRLGPILERAEADSVQKKLLQVYTVLPGGRAAAEVHQQHRAA